MDRAEALIPLGSAFLRVWSGQVASIIGSMVSMTGVAVFVYLETGSEAWLGVLAALVGLPVLLVGPFLGRLDRVPRRTGMLVGDVVAAVGPMVALGLSLFGQLQPWHLAAAAFAGGAGSAIQGPAALAAVPALVERPALDRANGLMQLGPAVGLVIGPMLATPLVVQWGIRAVLLVDLITFLIAISATAATRFVDVDVDVEGGPAGADEVVDDRSWSAGWRWLRGPGQPLLALLLVLSAVNFGLAMFNVALLALATSVGGPARAGSALAIGGLVLVVGSLAVGRRGLPRGRIATISRGLLVFAAGSLVAGVRPVFGLVVLGVAIALVGVPAVNAAVSTLFHERVPASLHGRVFGLRGAIGQALQPVGAIVAGLLIARVLAPAVDGDGPVGRVASLVIGVGPGRGAAALVLLVGLGLGVVGLWIGADRRLGALDRPVHEGRGRRPESPAGRAGQPETKRVTACRPSASETVSPSRM